MACTSGIVKDIVSNCTTAINGSLEVLAWIWNRNDITITYDNTYPNMITNLAKAGADTAFTVEGVKKLLNAGHDIVTAENRPDKWTQHFYFEQFERLAADILNVTQLQDVVVVVEAKDKGTGGDGTFFCYGAKHGLYLVGDTMRHNENNGARVIELATQAGEEEPYPVYIVKKTDYATTLSLLNGLLT